MNTQDEVRNLAYRYRAKLLLYFASSSVGFLFFGWLGAWAQHQTGWEADGVSFFFVSISTLALFFSLFTGILIFRWYKLSSRAFSEADKFSEDPVWFRSIFKEVIGPSPW